MDDRIYESIRIEKISNGYLVSLNWKEQIGQELDYDEEQFFCMSTQEVKEKIDGIIDLL